jgi:hypothetical protein
MVHAYLMYGYPTQTIQETIDSLEMVSIIWSGIYNRVLASFAMTAHSPVGLYPEQFELKKHRKHRHLLTMIIIPITGINHDKFRFWV